MVEMTNVLCLLMQKNERDLLPVWIKYHAALFGAKNLVIVDNASEDEEVLRILENASAAGARVLTSTERVEKKGDIIGALIREYDILAEYSMFLPLDCDEFVGTLKGSEVYFDRATIDDELQRHCEYRGVLEIAGSYYNIPGPGNLFFFQKEAKVFFPANTFSYVDYGYHSGFSRAKLSPRSTNIIHVHYQHKPLALLRQHAREKLKARVDVDDELALKAYAGPGDHLVKYFFMDQNHYKDFLGPSRGVQLPNFLQKLAEENLKPPF